MPSEIEAVAGAHPYRTAGLATRTPRPWWRCAWARVRCAFAAHAWLVRHVNTRRAIAHGHQYVLSGIHRECVECGQWACYAGDDCPVCLSGDVPWLRRRQ
jgi:hypothetical protein